MRTCCCRARPPTALLRASSSDRPELPRGRRWSRWLCPARPQVLPLSPSAGSSSSLSFSVAPKSGAAPAIDVPAVSRPSASWLPRVAHDARGLGVRIDVLVRCDPTLDPFGEHTDGGGLEAAAARSPSVSLLRAAAAAADLASNAYGAPWSMAEAARPTANPQGDGARRGVDLEMEIAEGGGNLSAGMRQLVMLARAMLRRSQLLLMDEATANIDYATDAVIQRVVREQFRSSTILTIAHRLDTIIDYDTVLLMADGRVAESGRPADLLASDQSKFHALVARGGDAVVTRLKAAAATSPTRAST